MSKFVVIEGIDGCGKSTQVHELITRFLCAGIIAWNTKEPCQPWMQQALETSDPLTKLLLYSADRKDHVWWIKRMLDCGWVVSDRYIMSTDAYQGTDPSLDRAFVNECIRQSITVNGGLLLPDLTIILSLPVEEAVRRVEERDGRLLADDERDVMARAHQAYEQMCQLERVGDISLWLRPGNHIVKIDCDGKSQEQVGDEVWGVVQDKLINV
jgi:dTMP kinase